MKNLLRPALLSLILLCFLAIAQVGLAQDPPKPPSNDQKGTGGNKGPSGESTPIDGGVCVALAMVAGYGAYKWLKVVQKKSQTAND